MACDQWSCPYCQRILAWRWAERVRYGIALRTDCEPWFWTLTLPAWVETPEVGYRVLPDRWAHLREKLRWAFGRFTYAAFVEEHPQRNLIPHFHIITFQPSPRRLKDLAVSAGFGFEAKEREICGPEAVRYVSKYVSKQGQAMPRGFRRVRVSQDWPRLPEPTYEFAVYPQKSGETLSAYVYRVAGLLGMDVRTLLARYTEAKMAIQPARSDRSSEEAQQGLDMRTGELYPF